MALLENCIYCHGEHPCNKRKAKRLRDTRANRQRENSLYRAIGKILAQEAEQPNQ